MSNVVKFPEPSVAPELVTTKFRSVDIIAGDEYEREVVLNILRKQAPNILSALDSVTSGSRVRSIYEVTMRQDLQHLLHKEGYGEERAKKTIRNMALTIADVFGFWLIRIKGGYNLIEVSQGGAVQATHEMWWMPTRG